MKHIASRAAGLIAALAVATGGLSIVAPVTIANASETSTASEPPSCEDVTVGEGTGECADVVEGESHSQSSSTSRAVSVNGVKLNSNVTVLARIKANGTPQSQQDDCFTIDHAMSLWTSYNAEGTTGWHWKDYPKGKRFCHINGAVRDPVCHNMVKIGVPKSQPPENVITGKVKFVKRLHWVAKAKSVADEKVTSKAEAWCNTSAGSAYGSGKASAMAYAVGRARMKGHVLIKLLARVKARATGKLAVKLEGKSVVQVRGEVRSSAFAKATSEAHASATCKDTPPAHDECPNIPGDQPPGYECNPPGSIVNVTDVNDVVYGNTRTIQVRGVVPDGQTATLRVSAGKGTIADADKVISLGAGDFVRDVTYRAPTEGSSDTVTFKLYGSDGVLDDQAADTFDLKEPPIDPQKKQ